jgi:hypothetical protein
MIPSKWAREVDAAAKYVAWSRRQQSNYDGFPKAAELIEIRDTHPLEASDRAIFNQLLQIAHDSGRLTEADAECEVSLAHLRQAQSRHTSNDRIRESIGRIMNVVVQISYVSASGEARTHRSPLLNFTDTSDKDSPNAMGVQIEMVRRHPRAPAHAVIFGWWRKQGDEYRAAMNERQRSKVGRMARLRGQVETMVGLGAEPAAPPQKA